MTLSILIPTLPSRYEMLSRLRRVLDPQIAKYNGAIEVKLHDRIGIPTGSKRNELITMAAGDYFCFIDDDDMISHDYIDEIMAAINQAPDVVTFNGWMTTNGSSRVNWVIKLGEKYEERGGMYYRFPNHLCVFKKDLVRRFTFPPIYQGEDYQFAKSIHDSGVLKTEIHIDKQLYHYDFRTHKLVGR